MANWKTYKILSKKRLSDSHCALDIRKFELDDYVDYQNGREKWIMVEDLDSDFFYNWEVGDYIKIDVEKTRNKYKSDSFIRDKKIAKILDGEMMNKMKKLQIELCDLKNAKERLAPLFNSFSQKVINNNFFDFSEALDEFTFDEFALSVWKRRIDNMTNKFEELKKGKSSEEKECNELRAQFYRKNRENEENKDKLEKIKGERQNEKLKWEGEKRDLQVKVARLEEKSNNANTRKTELEKEVEEKKKEVREKDNENGRLLIKLDEKSDQINVLKLESGKKGNELKKKDEEIQRLKKWAELSQEELLKEKIRSERENLEFFAAELKADLEQIHGLSKYHERLFQAQKKHNQANIETHESNIARAKQELLEKKKISMVNIQEICRKCEKLAELRWELEQAQQRQIQTNDWKNINSNFTPELVQEWINQSFTHEQCREWISTASPWQQNRAIKEPAYYAWLRDIRKVNAEWVLNHGNEQELGEEFFQWYQGQYQTQQEQLTK